LRQSIVIAKPVRHENPARESFVGGCQEAALVQGCSSPAPLFCPGPSRVTNPMHSVGRFRQRKISKILTSCPTAGLRLPNFG
jgi:hypothetical protein